MDNKLMKVFAANLTYQMNRNGLKQADLVEMVGVSKSAVSNWCLGSALPRMDKVDKLTKIFGCSSSDLLEERKVEAVAIPVKTTDFSHLIAFKTADMTAEQIEVIKNLIITLGGEIV